MSLTPIVQRAALEAWTDEDAVSHVLTRNTDAFEVIMRRYNQRLYRVALGIVGNPAEAEDVMQDAYVRAFEHLAQFEHRAKFSTWLARIAVHEALARVRRKRSTASIEDLFATTGELTMPSTNPNPEQEAGRRQARELVEKALLSLQADYRIVIVLRDIEQMSTAEAAEVLDISQENLKVRLSRARAVFREQLCHLVGPEAKHAFVFEAPRCDQVVKAVFERISENEKEEL